METRTMQALAWNGLSGGVDIEVREWRGDEELQPTQLALTPEAAAELLLDLEHALAFPKFAPALEAARAKRVGRG